MDFGGRTQRTAGVSRGDGEKLRYQTAAEYAGKVGGTSFRQSRVAPQEQNTNALVPADGTRAFFILNISQKTIQEE